MKRILMILTLLTSFLFAEKNNLVEEYTNINSAKVTNPAWIVKNFQTNSYSYIVKTDNEQGEAKLPYESEKKMNLNYIATGEKELFPGGVFSGYVSFHQQFVKNQQWMHNRMPYQGFPFLLADSSTGGIKLNGIHWQLGYGQEIIKDRLYFGSRLFYNVDEEIKQVFPKPINKHRDIYFSVGLGAIANRHLKLGLNYNYIDIQEILKTTKYSENQDKTPIFFKIRGLDNPLVFHAITGIERNVDFVGSSYQLDGELNYGFIKKLDFVAGFNRMDSEAADGTTEPINQGKADIEGLYFSTELLLPLWNENNLRIFSYGNQSELIAEHPELKVDVFEYRRKSLAVGTGLQINIAEKLSVNPNIYGSSQYLKREDQFNGILEYYPATTFGGSCDLSWKGKILIELQPGYEAEKLDDVEIFSERTEWYYTQVTEMEQQYYGSDKTRIWLNSKITLPFKNNKNLIFTANYNHLTAEKFNDKARNGINIGLCFEIRN